MPAKFRRQLKTTHAKLGSLIRDTPVAQKLLDVYDGQVTLFNQFQGLAAGIIPLGNMGNNCQYLIEFPTISKPLYGESNLIDIDLFTYTENISVNYDYATPILEVYKLKRDVPTVGTFDTGASKFANIMFGSANYENMPSIVENWSGVEATHVLADADSVENLTEGDPYIPWEQALDYHREQVGTSWGMKRDVFKDRYTEVRDGERRVYYKKKYAYMYKPRKGCKWYQNDPELDILKVDLTMAKEYSPMWQHEFDEQLIKWDVGRRTKANLTGGLNNEDIENSVLSTAGVDNSLFSKIQYCPPKTKNQQYECFSFPYVVSTAPGRTGRALRMHSYIQNNAHPIPEFSYGGGYPSACQTIFLETRIPMPMAWLRETGSKTQHMMNSTVVEIDVCIREMTKYETYKVGDEPSAHDGSEDPTNFEKLGHLASRSFNVVFSNIPKPSSYSVKQWISRMNSGNSFNRQKGGVYRTGAATYAGVSIIAHESDIDTVTIDDKGIFTVVSTGEAGANKEAWGAATTETPTGETSFTECIYFKRAKDYRGSGTDTSIPSETQPVTGSLADDEGDADGTSWGEWFKMRFYLNGNNDKHSDSQSRLGFMLIDGNGNVQCQSNISLSPESSSSNAVDDMMSTSEAFSTPGFLSGGFPSYMSIFTHNKKIEKTEELFTNENQDATVDVYIGGIKIYGFEPGTRNATISEFNAAHAPAKISATSPVFETICDISGYANDGAASEHRGEKPISFKSNALGEYPLPTTLTWGINAAANPFDNDAFNIFLGGFQSENPALIDATDATKRMEFKTGSSNEEPGLSNAAGQSFISFYHNGRDSGSNNTIRGQDPCRLFLADVDANEFMNDVVTLTGDNHVDLFTKKGFISVSAMNHSGSNTYKDMNCTFSTKIIGMDGSAAHGKVRVLDPSKLKGHKDEEYIIFRTGYPGADDTNAGLYAKFPLKLKNQSFSGNLLELVTPDGTPADIRYGNGEDSGCVLAAQITGTGTTTCTYTGPDVFYQGDLIVFQDANQEQCIVGDVDASTNTLSLVRGHKTTKQSIITATTAIHRRSRLFDVLNLHELYISPYRHWINAEIINVAENGYGQLPDFFYSHSVITDNTTAPAATTLGATYNESLYTDTTMSTNTWTMTPSEGSEIETAIDFGYGTPKSKEFSNGKGFINRFQPQSSGTYNSVSLKGLVDKEFDTLNKPNEKLKLYVQSSDESEGSIALSTTKSSNDPYLEFIYEDKLPIIEDWQVNPFEEDPFFPEYSWKTQDKDLFYGFITIDNVPILHKYHGAVLHLPLNDDTTTAKGYKYDGTNNQTQITASEVVSLNTVLNREGLAGNAFDFDGTTAISVRVDDGDYTQPTAEMSLVAHFTVDSVTSTRYICSEFGGYRMWIDTSGNINAAATPLGATEVVLKSSTVVSSDGETPYCAIMTLDLAIGQGNLKLFINGKLEDQSGIKTTSGSANNWKANTNLADGSNDFFVGGYDSSDSGAINSGTYYAGMIEEVILYNKVLYPIVPQTGKAVIIKPVEELTTSAIASGISNVARLFIMDFHNIRGMNVDEVASTSMLSFRKSGLGLKTN